MYSLALSKPFHSHGLFPRCTREASPFDLTTVHLARRACGRGPWGDIINNRDASRLAITRCQNVPTSSVASLSMPSVVPDDQPPRSRVVGGPQARPHYLHAADVFSQFCQVVIYSAHCVTWSGGGLQGVGGRSICAALVSSQWRACIACRIEGTNAPPHLQIYPSCPVAAASVRTLAQTFFPSSPKCYITRRKRDNHSGATAPASLIHVF